MFVLTAKNEKLTNYIRGVHQIRCLRELFLVVEAAVSNI